MYTAKALESLPPEMPQMCRTRLGQILMILSGITRAKGPRTPSSIASECCDKWYTDAPLVFNEMINRNVLTPQGSTALYRLLGGMVERAGAPLLGIDGWGPDRAIYEAVLARSGIHRAPGLVHGLHPPSKSDFKPAWRKILGMAKGAGKRLPLPVVYESLSEPPYGVKAGLLPLLAVSVLLVCRDRIALYEHGTYCRAITTEITERLVRNPAHFEIKYFGQGAAARAAMQRVAGELGIRPRSGAATVSILDIVSHLVGVYASLTPHVKKTRMLSKRALAVRLAVETAVEPDALLLESLPRALGYGPMSGRAAPGQNGTGEFAAALAESLAELSGAFDAMLRGIVKDVLKSTSMPSRKKLSRAAAAVAPHVLDREMKVFLNAVSNDMIEGDEDWIKYAALTLTGVPPSEWSDEQRALFANRLRDISARFSRLASLHLAEVSDAYAHPAYRVTVTRPDGGEDNAIVSLPPDKASHVKRAADRAVRELRARGLADADDVKALLAELSGRLAMGRRR